MRFKISPQKLKGTSAATVNHTPFTTGTAAYLYFALKRHQSTRKSAAFTKKSSFPPSEQLYL